MGNNDEEDVFNALMGAPTGSEKATAGSTGISSINKILVDTPIIGTESSEELAKKFKAAVELGMEKVDNLFPHIQNGLGSQFERIKGAWMQYKEGIIGLDMLAYSGIIVLGKTFIDLFVEYKPKEQISAKPAPIPISAQSRDIFAENPFAPSSAPSIEPSHNAEENPFAFDLPEPVSSAPAKPTPKLEPQSSVNPQHSSPKASEVKIPSLFLTSDLIESSIPEPKPEPRPEVSKPDLKVMPTIKAPKKKKVSEISAFGKLEPSKSSVATEPPKISRVIASVAPETKTRSPLEAIGAIDSQIAEVKLEPMKFDKIDDSELKMVNVGATIPGSPLFDEFGTIEDLLHRQQYGLAEQKLKEIKVLAERQGLDYQTDRAEDMLMHLNVYRMLPSLVQGGDDAIEQDLDRAEEKYKKAMKFAKILNDSWYITKIDARLTQVNQRKAFLRKKKIIMQEEDDKIKKLIRDNIVRLGKTELLSSIPDIRKYCNAKSEEIVEEILIKMIENKEIYAKYFPDSKKVMFDKESNRMLAFKI